MKPAAIVLLVGLLASVLLASDDPVHEQHGFVYARIRYHLRTDLRGPREVAWHHDYPYGDEMFSTFLKEVSRVDTSREAYQIVDIDSKDLFKYPFAYLCEPGYLDLLPKDVANLKEYLDRGGFILVDDFREPWTLENLREQMKKVYPDRELMPLDITHPIFHTFYDMETLNVPPPYGRGPVEFLGLKDNHGNIQMIVNYNNDLSEEWEWLDRGEAPLHDAAESLKFGVNYLLYAMSH